MRVVELVAVEGVFPLLSEDLNKFGIILTLELGLVILGHSMDRREASRRHGAALKRRHCRRSFRSSRRSVSRFPRPLTSRFEIVVDFDYCPLSVH